MTRDGVVTRFKEAFAEHAEPREQKVTARQQVMTVPQSKVDVDGLISTYRAHTWAATTGSHSDMIRPYDSLDEVRALMRQHRRNA